ncbi:NAD+ kinase [Alkalithermobacter thermoalcaliphilus JW-YL-7 = DSM 7308]|uniref:NAD kinase n=1 Tax=Alkalithermobacter thermoalcaliphilus JW-YL-7 = DSM 7308 TaxID=1121328 RepID=A0A150FRH3_CLOPD|nr:inorganic polyphosphate/ATP-NAD kinase [[Clostridium] paradoxum JW-YL-7 = DSM 7308]SHK42121.1 NAD+ kinase [[Clostridium] paradoxum JW-YL-7 = DSM 7308]
MKKIINITYNDYSESIETAKKLKEKLTKLGFYVPDTFSYDAQLIICIGGDGSFLKTVREFGFPDIPIVGINTGHLGFFQDIQTHEIDEFINAYINNEYFIQYINPIEASICTRKSCIETLGINEIVIKGDKSRTVHLNISVDNNFIERFSGDGVLISTPVGSTAYNYSAGGSIVDPKLKLMQITPLAPINTNAYRSFTSSIILSSDSIVEVSPEYRFENSILIVTDGIEYRFNEIVKIVIQTSEISVKLLKLKNGEFWSKVAEKFL